jgi:hypothetical protein
MISSFTASKAKARTELKAAGIPMERIGAALPLAVRGNTFNPLGVKA